MGSTEVTTEEMLSIEVDFAKIKNYMMSFPPKTRLVRILDACLKRDDWNVCSKTMVGWTATKAHTRPIMVNPFVIDEFFLM